MKATQLVQSQNVRVTMPDGAVHDYTTTPLDHWRAEKLTGQSLSVALDTFTGWAALAYSCAMRAGHAYKPRKATTDQRELFEGWLESISDVSILSDDDEGAADPLDEATSPETSPS